MRSPWRAVGAALLVTFTCGGLDQNDLACEDAAAHLKDCCSSLSYTFVCNQTQPQNCNGQPVSDYASASQVACLEKMSCDAIRAAGICETPATSWPCQ